MLLEKRNNMQQPFIVFIVFGVVGLLIEHPWVHGAPLIRPQSCGNYTSDAKHRLNWSIPIGSMYGIFTYIWVIFGVNVGKYSIHGASGIGWQQSNSSTIIWFSSLANLFTIVVICCHAKWAPRSNCLTCLVFTHPPVLHCNATLVKSRLPIYRS